MRFRAFGASPLPHPATHRQGILWVAGRGSGLAPLLRQEY